MVSFACLTLRQTIRNNIADMQENYYENLHNLIIMLAGILWTCFIILFLAASRTNFAATPLVRPARQNRHATQAKTLLVLNYNSFILTVSIIGVGIYSTEAGG